MSAQQTEEFNNLVFQDRNKNFGAFSLRKRYAKNIGISFLVSAGTFFLLLVPFSFKTKEEPKEVVKEVVINLDEPITIEEPPPPDVPPPPPPPKAKVEPPKEVKTVRYVPPEPVPDEEIVEEEPEDIPDQEEIKEAAISNETKEGEEESLNEVIVEEGSEDGVIGGTGDPDNEVFDPFQVQQPAEFPGGQAGIRKHLEPYLVQNKRLNIKARVLAQFVVERDGSVSNVKLEVPVPKCESCNEEIISGLKDLTASPAKANGRSVRMLFKLPLTLDF